MLTVTIPAAEYYDDKTGEFYSTVEQKLELEHSLLSLSRWESKWKKPFLSTNRKTYEETTDYIRCMNLSGRTPPETYKFIPRNIIEAVNKYIEDSMTATTIKETPGRGHSNRGEMITSELIYYWMIEFGIPFECQKWHLNRLLMLIRVCDVKQANPKKMGKRDIFANNKALNASRRARSGSRG